MTQKTDQEIAETIAEKITSNGLRDLTGEELRDTLTDINDSKANNSEIVRLDERIDDVEGTNGIDGEDGWSPILEVVTDVSRKVLRVGDWTGGEGTKPVTGKFIGASGFVNTAAEAVDISGPAGSAGTNGTNGTDGADGADGEEGWTPIFSVVTDGARRVLQVTDWTGGEGTKPTTGLYVGATGLEALIANGVDIRGAAGATGAAGDDGWSPVFAVVTDGARRVLQVSDWVGGAGSKPTTGQYVGASGLEALIANAVDIRGGTGATGSAGTNGTNGADGNDGWTPVFSVVTDGARRVLQVSDWVGGEGTKPDTGKYVGASGLETLIANAVDIRGAAGAAGADGDDGTNGTNGADGADGDDGWSPVFAVVNDGTRRVLQVTDWVGGAGSKPTTGLYVGATGLEPLIASGVDVRGGTGATGAAGTNGTNGEEGWTPIFSVVADGARRVLQVTDWTGGTGSKPTTGQYVGATGLEALIANGVDIRGAAGTNGTNGTNGSDALFAGRTMTGTANQITVTNGSGAGGNPTFSLSNNIDPAKLADGSVSVTEFQYINSLTSNVQTQLDAKISSQWSTVTGGISYTGGRLIITGTDTTVTMASFQDLARVYVDEIWNPASATSAAVRCAIFGRLEHGNTNNVSGVGHYAGAIFLGIKNNTGTDDLVIGCEGRVGALQGTISIAAALLATFNTNTEDAGTMTYGVGFYLTPQLDDGHITNKYYGLNPNTGWAFQNNGPTILNGAVTSNAHPCDFLTAWVNCDTSSGSPVNNGSFNVAGFVDNGAGNTTVTYSTALAAGGHAVVATGGGVNFCFVDNTANTANFKVYSYSLSTLTLTDGLFCAMVAGGK